jgi:hypothetical protein
MRFLRRRRRKGETCRLFDRATRTGHKDNAAAGRMANSSEQIRR